MPDWSPVSYLKFEDQRTRPARELLAQVPLLRPRHVVDMGCGPGNSTELLTMRYPGAEITGIDTSPAMLTEARRRVPSAEFELGDARVWLPEPDTELVFANAIYQWVPDHLQVITKVLDALSPGAILAVQMPDNTGEPSHRLMREVAADGPWTKKLGGAIRKPLFSVNVYYDALTAHASRVDIWHTRYIHALADANAIVDWVTSTGLRPFLDPLDPEEREGFRAAYLERIARAYHPAKNGKVLLRFPRLFLVMQK